MSHFFVSISQFEAPAGTRSVSSGASDEPSAAATVLAVFRFDRPVVRIYGHVR